VVRVCAVSDWEQPNESAVQYSTHIQLTKIHTTESRRARRAHHRQQAHDAVAVRQSRGLGFGPVLFRFVRVPVRARVLVAAAGDLHNGDAQGEKNERGPLGGTELSLEENGGKECRR